MDNGISFTLAVAASIAAAVILAALAAVTRPRMRVRAGYSDSDFSCMVLVVRNRSLRWIRLDELGLLVDGKAAPLTPREFDARSPNAGYRPLRVRPFGSSSIELPPQEVERRVALVLHYGFHTGTDLRGYAKVGERVFRAAETFTW